MFPDSDDQRDRLWEHIQDTPELQHLLTGNPKDVEDAFEEYWAGKGEKESKTRYKERTQEVRKLMCKGFLHVHGRAISTKQAKDENPETSAAELAWWRSAGAWGDGTGYRRGSTALDAGPFLVALASAFCKSALAFSVAGHPNGLKSDPVDGLVIVTLEQAAWASFKLQQLMTDKKKGLPEAHRGGIIEEMARLKKELLENGVKPVGLKLITNDPELKDLLS